MFETRTTHVEKRNARAEAVRVTLLDDTAQHLALAETLDPLTRYHHEQEALRCWALAQEHGRPE